MPLHHDAHAKASWEAPLTSPSGTLWLRVLDGPVPLPLGLYASEDDTPGVSSYEVPAGSISSALRAATHFLESIDDITPGPWDALFKIVLAP